MKRVTNKTAMNIYTRWMTISAAEYDFIFDDKNMSLDDIAKDEKNIIKLKYVLEDYTDKQLQKIIFMLERGICWGGMSMWLNDRILHLLKAILRERKLNHLQID
jgi:hypothetical protein